MSLWWQIFLYQVMCLTPIVGIPAIFAARAFVVCDVRLAMLWDLRIKPPASALSMVWHPRYWLLWTERQWIRFVRAVEGDGLGQRA